MEENRTRIGLSRFFDLAVSIGGLLPLTPLFLVIGVLVKLDSEGPVFYLGRRMGKGGKIFGLYKFRTMRIGADKSGPGITAAGDHRITRVGRWLRRTKIDELPQLLNVFKGEMALVGPRPEDPRYLKYYSARQLDLFNLKPGITSLASVYYRQEENFLSGPDWEEKYVTEILPLKLNMELEYQEKRTWWSDLKILWKTFLSLPVPRMEQE